jgi:putative membrane protein
MGMLASVSSAARFPAWHAHLDVWALIVVLEATYLVVLRRERSRRGPADETPTTRRQMAAFTAGVAVLWLASDWPVHDLAEGFLYSAHMVQHLLMTLVAAPLLLLGTPTWLARRLLGVRPPHAPGAMPAADGASAAVPPPTTTTRRLAAVRWIGRPVPGLLQYNLVLVLSHWPLVVEQTLLHHPLHFVAHAVLLVSAVLMWLPVVSPLPEVPRVKPPTQMLYLFLQTVVPTVPASFLTFGAHPLYHIYETFPRLWGIPALTDQQVAGLIMKVGGGFYLWTIIGVIFFQWYGRESAADAAPPAAGADDVLTWADVERELNQLEGGGPARR